MGCLADDVAASALIVLLIIEGNAMVVVGW